MDETARPHDQMADEPEAAGVIDASGDTRDGIERPPTEQDTPVPRLELEADPFAPVDYAAAASEQDDAAEHAPAETAPEESEGAAEYAPAEAEPEESDAEYAPAEAAPEESEGAAEETHVESTPPSLDDMVSELATDETPVGAGPDELETGPEVETVEGEEATAAEADEEAETEAAASWREEAAAEVAVPMLVRQRLSMRLPFWIYGGVWVVFAGVMTYLMWPLSEGPFVEAQFYSYFVLGSAALLALGPFLGLAVWLWGRTGATAVERGGLVLAVLLRVATWMTVGVAVMWICLYVLDLHRTGVIG